LAHIIELFRRSRLVQLWAPVFIWKEIVDEAVTSEALAEKTGMSWERARQIFQHAYTALERRLEGGQD
jgi:hypothetical protein